jgi:hypothetical protein
MLCVASSIDRCLRSGVDINWRTRVRSDRDYPGNLGLDMAIQIRRGIGERCEMLWNYQ